MFCGTERNVCSEQSYHYEQESSLAAPPLPLQILEAAPARSGTTSTWKQTDQSKWKLSTPTCKHQNQDKMWCLGLRGRLGLTQDTGQEPASCRSQPALSAALLGSGASMELPRCRAVWTKPFIWALAGQCIPLHSSSAWLWPRYLSPAHPVMCLGFRFLPFGQTWTTNMDIALEEASDSDSLLTPLVKLSPLTWAPCSLGRGLCSPRLRLEHQRTGLYGTSTA